jgi:hypothetical protein
MATYTYDILDDFPEGSVHTSKFHKEIEDSSIATELLGLNTRVDSGDGRTKLDVIFDGTLTSGEKTTLDGDTSDPAGGLIAAHDNNPYTKDDVEWYLNPASQATINGITGDWNVMQILQHRKDLYNDSDSPLYDSTHQPILGSGGILEDHGDKITNLETIHNTLGWHNQQVLQALYAKPKDLLIYYGWTNSFNSGTNGWDNWKVALDMARYEMIVFGSGLEETSHGDHANMNTIIGYVRSLNPNTKFFGYVSVNQSYNDFIDKVDKWDTNVGVDGIFMDEAGYDYGKTRDEFNDRVDYVHGVASSSSSASEGEHGPDGLIAFANAWNLDHILGTANDTSYPNTTYNSDLQESHLGVNDWVLVESFAINTQSYTASTPDGYEPKADWAARGSKMLNLRATYGVNVAGVCVIQDSHASDQAMFDFAYTSALMWSLGAFGSSDHNYGSSSAKTEYLTRLNTEGLRSLWSLNPAVRVDVNDGDIYRRFIEHAQMYVDFSSSAQTSALTKE